MNKAEKQELITQLKERLETQQFFYITDSSTLTVEQTNKLRRVCFEKGVELKVYKNTLVKKALEQLEGDSYEALYGSLKGPTALMFSDTSNTPAKIIKEFRKTLERPVLKAAYIDSDVFIGDDQIDALASLKSKEELIGEIIGLLQSPIQSVVGSLQSGGNTLAGIIKTLSEKEG